MNEIDEILKDVNLAITRKKSEIHKVELGNVLFEAAQKAFNSGISSVEVLVYDLVIDKNRNEFMFNQYKKGYVLNHSVGMRYMKLLFCYDSEQPEYTSEKEDWDKYYPQILNQEDADSRSWFWAITEAKNVEGSAVVKGSNFLTPVLEVEIIDDNTIKVKCAVSPSNILDSHGDVHIEGLWKKALKENKYDLFLQEHDMDFDKVIADSISGDLNVYTELINVKTLMSKFKTSKKSEPSSNTHDKRDPKPPADTLDETKRRNTILLTS